jgi:hypothetical protein
LIGKNQNQRKDKTYMTNLVSNSLIQAVEKLQHTLHENGQLTIPWGSNAIAQFLSAEGVSAALQFKKGLPTEEGWYWHRTYCSNPSALFPPVTVTVVYVRWYAGDLAIGNSTLKDWPEMVNDAEWAGPIPQPTN